mgnify:CR=1 FL=1|jgi:hypothetical protein|tara:strand:- start:2781 stop:3443 length:663 start_codon:yes stop_codon:yes gene_type:complete
MAITHSDFLQQVRDYTEVGSTVLSDSLIQRFIRSVELDIAGKVDYDDTRKYATSTFTAGNRAVSIPADSLILRSVEHISGTTRTFLEKRDISFISEFNGTGKQGTPKYFANYDAFNILVAPTPAAADTIQINYIKDPPEFTSTNQTFLAKYQESMLLHGVLTEAYSFLKGPDNLYNLYKGKYNEELQNFALQQMGRRRRAEYDDGVPRVRVPSPSPNTSN